MIILEGPDGSGKTSLAEKLSEHLEIPIAPKAVSSDSKSMTDVRRWADRSLDQGYHRTIYDRHGLISEGIYGPVWNGKLRAPYDDPIWLRQAHARLADIAPTIIMCLPPVEEVVKNIRKDPQNAALYGRVESESLAERQAPTDRHVARVPKGIGQIYYQYQWYAAKHLNVFEYDYTEHDFETTLVYVRAMIYNRLEK